MDAKKLTNEVAKVAKDILERNRTLLTGRFYEPVDDYGVLETLPDFPDIRRVVERNIIPAYDHPKIVDAVADYLYQRIWMM